MVVSLPMQIYPNITYIFPTHPTLINRTKLSKSLQEFTKATLKRKPMLFIHCNQMPMYPYLNVVLSSLKFVKLQIHPMLT